MEDANNRNERQHEKEERRKYAPYKFSGKSYSFDITNEKSILDYMREWSLDYFQKNYVIRRDMYSLLKDVKLIEGENKDFDLLCKVLKVFEKDENSLELRIKDIS
jgi:hypothetical protein